MVHNRIFSTQSFRWATVSGEHVELLDDADTFLGFIRVSFSLLGQNLLVTIRALENEIWYKQQSNFQKWKSRCIGFSSPVTASDKLLRRFFHKVNTDFVEHAESFTILKVFVSGHVWTCSSKATIFAVNQSLPVFVLLTGRNAAAYGLLDSEMRNHRSRAYLYHTVNY